MSGVEMAKGTGYTVDTDARLDRVLVHQGALRLPRRMEIGCLPRRIQHRRAELAISGIAKLACGIAHCIECNE